MNKKSPWAWVPTLYFAEGLPYVAVMTISLIMYKRLGLSNTDITLYTSWLYLPWVIKPLWSPFIDIIKTKRWWIVVMQLLIGAALGGVAFTIPAPYWLQGSLAFFWLMAFASATHDIAADGFYMLGLEQHAQAYFVGIRSTFYRIATIVGQGLLVMLAGNLEVVTRNIKYSWSLMFYGMAGLFIAFWLWHHYILPRPTEDKGIEKMHGRQIMQEFWHTLKTFFQKPQVWAGICFMLFYRMPEGLLAKVSALFLIDATAKGSPCQTSSTSTSPMFCLRVCSSSTSASSSSSSATVSVSRPTCYTLYIIVRASTRRPIMPSAPPSWHCR